MATLGMSAADRDAIEAFRRDVVEPSMTKLVIIDFWAEWCGPCKALAPMLDKVAAAYADKGVVLAKIDTDKNQFIANQFQIRSIPTVYAMFEGQLVADLTSARAESQLRAMLDQLLRQLPVEAGGADAATGGDAEAELAPLIAMAEQVLAEGDAARACSIFEQLADMAPDHMTVRTGHIRALVADKQLDAAQAALAALPAELAALPDMQRAATALALAREAPAPGALAALEAAVARNPGDMGARLALANGLMATGDHDAAADMLLAMIAENRGWNEGAARQRLLQLFEVVGLEDPWVAAQRRRLSAILFG